MVRHFKATFLSVQYCSVLWLIGLSVHVKDDLGEIACPSILREAILSSSGMGKDVHSLTSSIQLCRQRRRQSSKMPLRMVFERISLHADNVKEWASLRLPILLLQKRLEEVSAETSPMSPRRPKQSRNWTELNCRGTWHVRTMPVSVFWRLLEDISVGPQGSCSFSTPGLRSFAPSMRCEEA